MPQQQAPALPDPKTAYDHLFSNIHARAFYSRLAQHGLAPANEKQAQEYLELAGKLRAIEADPRVKAAEAQNDPIAEVNRALDGAMERHGLGSVKAAKAQEADVARRNVAVKLAADAGIYNSVLSLKAAEASQIAAQLGLGQARN